MLEEYEDLIYRNEEEKQKVYDDIINYIAKHSFHWTKELLLESKWNLQNSGFFGRLSLTEGKMLFELCAEKFGNKMWCKDKIPKMCKRRCPFGDVCKKYVVDIEGRHFCSGQLYYRGIKCRHLYRLADKKSVKLLDSKGNVCADLNRNNKQDINAVVSYFQENGTDFFEWFGDEFGNKLIAKL